MVYKVVQQSAVLRPTSTLGVVTSGPKVSVTRLGAEHFLTSPVGSSFHIYDCEDLKLQYLSRPLLGNVSCAVSIGEVTIVGVGMELLVFRKMELLAKLCGHAEVVADLLAVESDYLVSRSSGEVLVWELPKLTRSTRPTDSPLSPLFRLPVSFSVSSMLHVPGYANKILLAGAELELWNVKSGKRIYAFKSAPESPIRVMAASPAEDVVGLGDENGTISIINVRSDESLMTLHQAEHGPVTALAFRADYADGMLVSGTTKGDLVVWDLSKRSVHSFLQNAHPGGVGSLHFLSSMPLMVSSGVCDNAISIYIFDKPDGGCRLLKERRGFTVPLSFMLPYGEHELLVAGSSEWASEVGKINLIQSQQNLVWSQNNLGSQTAGKDSRMPWKFRHLSALPPVVAMAHCGSWSSKLRHFDWPTVITAHKNIRDTAYVWSAHQQCLVTRQLIIPRQQSSNRTLYETSVTAVAVSACGNYAVLGCDNGEIHRFNLQSCYHRGLVGVMDSPVVELKYLSGRDVLAASKEEMRLFKVVPRAVELGRVTCVSGISKISVHGFLCAVAHDDQVSIVDIHGDKLARRVGTVGEVTALAWSHGGRWLAVATQDDKCLVIYDVPTAGIVDRVQFASACIGIHFQKGNTQIVTAHADGSGAVRVWQNVALLEGPGHLSETPVMIDEWTQQEAPAKRQKTVVPTAVEHSSNELTLSAKQWQQILRLDEIKERNKPVRPAEKPKEAPFFLPVKYQGVQPVFVESVSEETSILTPRKEEVFAESAGDFVTVLNSAAKDAIAFLANQTPSGVHIALAQLEDDQDALNVFIGLLAEETALGRNADLVATWTSLLLKQYGREIKGRQIFASNLAKLHAAAESAFRIFTAQTNQVQCLLKVAAALQLHR